MTPERDRCRWLERVEMQFREREAASSYRPQAVPLTPVCCHPPARTCMFYQWRAGNRGIPTLGHQASKGSTDNGGAQPEFP